MLFKRFPTPALIKERAYDKAVSVTLKLYEKWILPPNQKISLKELKLQEYRDRKKLLHPYQKEELLSKSTPDEIEKYTKLAQKTKFRNMNFFVITYDRHLNRYGFKTSDFPESYHPNMCSLTYMKDPDWTKKLELVKVNLKKYVLIVIICYLLLKWRVKRVELFDKRKRQEQRAMQNSEIQDLHNKKVQFVIFDKNNKEFTE